MTAVQRELDPFNAVYDAVWTMLNAHEGFTDLCKVGNRETFGTGASVDPDRAIASEGDMPLLGIIPAGGTANLLATSSESAFTEKYQAVVITGDKRIGTKLNPLRWQIIRALSNWITELTGFKWNDRDFCVTLLQVADTSTAIDVTKGVTGWTAVISIHVDIRFPTAMLQQA